MKEFCKLVSIWQS